MAAPPAPWDCQVSSIIWVQNGTPAAEKLVPDQLRGTPRFPVTVGALNSYSDSPVGPYNEVVALPCAFLRPFPQGHVAFIAVDNEASVHGGRDNWALPKVLARFADPAPGGPMRAVVMPDWEISVSEHLWPLRVPVWASLWCCQVWADGTVRKFRARGRGWLRPLVVDLKLSGTCPLSTWLVPGRHVGVAFSGRAHFGVARP
jgi:hypothetical protein